MTHPCLAGVRAVCFDAGNVLKCVDRERVHRLLGAMGVHFDPAKWLPSELAARDAINQLASTPGSNDRAHAIAYWNALLTHLGVEPGQIEAARAAVFADSRRENIWKCAAEGASEALGQLRARGFRLAVVSNADGRCEDDLSCIGIREHLDFIIDSRVVGVEKPDPAIFRIAADRLQTEPSRICYVGDIYHIDVMGAQGAGMIPVLLDPRGTQHPDCITVRSLAELIEILPLAPALE